ncbi:MAG: zinc-dependent metalloprotease, partial [Pseudomonadota bacterium]
MTPTARPLFLLFLLLTASVSATAQSDDINEWVEDTVALEGFMNLYWDEDEGRLWLRIDRFDEPFLYQSYLARGVGSNDIGLDRGQLGPTRLVSFVRSGPKVLLLQHNPDYRARSDDPAERAAVEASFARSVIWGFEAEVSQGDAVLVDATAFFLRDAHGMGTWLSRSREGSYSTEESRSFIYLPRTKSFPDNTEIEALVTFTGQRQFDGNGQAASNILPTVVPDTTAITVHMHHSFIRLPDDGYEPLPYDPRGGMFVGTEFLDYASEIGTPLRIRYAARHRLERTDPAAERSPAVEPIIFYLDPGAPEPVRSALLDGARWWNQAFEAAGFEDAYEVRMLPPDADPMDVRYNVIQWVHRSTRGWSYGSSVIDPRTGEIIKGNVTLGSLRVRQDYMIAEGLLAPYADDTVPDTMLNMSLARIRQLSAHEVGHTLGIAHNFAASANDRASVMDYPFPLVRFGGSGGLDFSEAYGVGIGGWDARTVDYAYRDFPAGTDRSAARTAILEQTFADGFLYVTDADARSAGGAHPDGNLWDNGADALVELDRLLGLRAHALERFDERVVRPGQPLATLEEALVPIYLLHRFQLQAVGKLLGGARYSYALRGDGLPPTAPVTRERQQAALEALLGLLASDSLALPDPLLASLPPRPPGHYDDRERWDRHTGTLFDPLAPADSLTTMVLDVLLHPDRAARLNAQASRDPDLPDFNGVLDALLEDSWFGRYGGGMEGALQRQTQRRVQGRLMSLAAHAAADGQVQAQARAALTVLQSWLVNRTRRPLADQNWAVHHAAALGLLEEWTRNPDSWPA